MLCSNDDALPAAAEAGTRRSVYWDAVKGAAIFLVVLGHCGGPSVPLAYIINYSHLANFFFVAGALYKDKYSAAPLTYMGKRLRSIYFPAVKYILAYILLHNLFIRMNIYSTVTTEAMIYPKSYYGAADILSTCFQAICGGIWAEEMGGALWFCLPLIVSLSMFCLLRYPGRWIKRTAYREMEIVIFSGIIGALGLILTVRSIHLAWRSELAMLSVPVVCAGYLFGEHIQYFFDKVNIFYALPCAGALVYLYYGRSFEISFAAGIVTEPLLFYPATFCGIYCCLFLAKLLCRSSFLSRVAAKLGSLSFHVMALHFLAFKIVNLLFVVVNDCPLYIIAMFPYAYSGWWYLNLLAGLVVPPILVLGYRRVKETMAKSIHVNG